LAVEKNLSTSKNIARSVECKPELAQDIPFFEIFRRNIEPPKVSLEKDEVG
jgi:hypothetical protein